MSKFGDPALAARASGGGHARHADLGEDAEFAFATGVSAGWCARGGLADESRLFEAWRSIRKAERFWRDDDAVRKGESS